jgi:Na+/H+-translocating membrane pyrophosphatase
MTFPPSLLRLRVRTPEHAWPTLWLPLFLVWPLLLLLLVPLVLVVLLVAIVLDPRQTARAFDLVGALFAVVCGLRGVHVDVVDRRAQVRISFH